MHNWKKYVRTKDGVILFKSPMKHSDFKQMEPISAGFFSIDIEDNKISAIKVYGKSDSLGIGPLENDDAHIHAYLIECSPYALI